MPTVGPSDGTLVVKTYREGVAAKVGHDLVIDVTSWQASLEGEQVELTADPRSLHVREGVRGVKPLTDKDRDDIRKTIDDKILRGQPIAFSGTARDEGGGLAVDGQLTMGGSTRPVVARLERAGDRVSATIPLTQSEWGIKPYRGLMGALKVRDDVEIVLDVALPAA
ncbi:MAG TPA: YceI family protein [Solirubrobacteraceae bacterium]|jgi:polyisoprenoid-binding protein YceI